MRTTFSQLTCLYQFWRFIFVSAMCTFLVSVARGREASGLDDMVCVCVKVEVQSRKTKGFLYLGPTLHQRWGAGALIANEDGGELVNRRIKRKRKPSVTRSRGKDEVEGRAERLIICCNLALIDFCALFSREWRASALSGECWVQPAPTLSCLRHQWPTSGQPAPQKARWQIT